MKNIFYNNIYDVIGNDDILKEIFKFILETNEGNFNPYHNFNHLLNTMTESYDASKYYNLEYKEYLELLISAIFHDYDHKGKKINDDINIENSKLGVKLFFEKFFKKEQLVYQYKDINIELNNIFKNIDATRFPYIIANENLNLSQQIIRDADLCQCYKYNWIHQNIMGLSNELDMNIKDFMIQQSKFLKNISFITEWGIDKFKYSWNVVLLEFEKLEKILK